MTNENVAQVNRTYKATMFHMLFEDRENLLDLYNAMSGRHYTDASMLEINTLENAIYMSMKNDVSFLIDGRLSLYEHQSTYSPNLPLRFLFYIANLYSGMTRNANLYGTKMVPIPLPEFVIFYNGKEELPDRQVLKLSDMYSVKGEQCSLELKAVMLNIRGTHNRKLKEACRVLREYAEFTDRVRLYAERMQVEEAVERAISECIREGILKEFLEKHRTEAKSMCIFEYDQEKHMRMEREDAWADGKAEGLEAGAEQERREIMSRMLKRGFSAGQIAEVCGVSEEEVKEYATATNEK